MRIAVMLSLLLIAIPLCTPATIPADLDKGLYWGVEVGDTIEFTWNITSDEGIQILYEQVYVNITSVPLIPDEVNESTILERPSYDLYYQNGTPADYVGLFDERWDILPIGNWTFIHEIVDAIPDVEAMEDSTFFGYTRSPYDWIFYLKSDGAVFKQEHLDQFGYNGIIRVGDYGEPITETTTAITSTTSTPTSTETQTSTGTSNGSMSAPENGFSDMLIIIGVSGGLVVVLIIVIIFRGKK